MKIYLLILFMLISECLFGQNKHISIGINGNGICFGNSFNYNGIRLNLWDQNTNKINGLNVSVNSVSKNLNGISAGILISMDSISNGIEIGGLVAKAKKHNGFAFGCLGLKGTKFNGLGLTGLILNADTLNGLFIGPLGVMPGNSPDSIRVISGFAAGGGVIACTMNGVSIAYFLN